ncbi:unnamed protein product [Miscanthus lutarioriparius]|uniref:Thaumatin-like protein n=1 Tax=Miscanthus lutarioriparius TaxID=422564 RepID=A0A811SQW0_9POAL|nr:unnamed protein product [Miscanthus lutarioriparius]
MASTSISVLFLLLLATFAASASAATFTVKNNCSSTVWPAAIPPPATLAEFSIGGTEDYYDISVIDGYNLPMAFSCSTGSSPVCTSPTCTEAYRFPNDDSKTPGCSGNSNYQLTFCP